MSQFYKPTKLVNRLLFCVASFIALSLASGQACAQEIRVAFFDGQRVLNESAPAKSASSRIKLEFSKREKELDDTAERLRSLARKYEKEGASLPESERIKRQRELTDLDQDINRKQRIFNEDLIQRKQEESLIIGERALKIVRQIAEAKKIDIVVQDAVYFNPRIDITDKVLKALAK